MFDFQPIYNIEEISLRYLNKPLIKHRALLSVLKPLKQSWHPPDVPREPPDVPRGPPDAPSEPPDAPSGPPDYADKNTLVFILLSQRNC